MWQITSHLGYLLIAFQIKFIVGRATIALLSHLWHSNAVIRAFASCITRNLLWIQGRPRLIWLLFLNLTLLHFAPVFLAKLFFGIMLIFLLLKLFWLCFKLYDQWLNFRFHVFDVWLDIIDLRSLQWVLVLERLYLLFQLFALGLLLINPLLNFLLFLIRLDDFVGLGLLAE